MGRHRGSVDLEPYEGCEDGQNEHAQHEAAAEPVRQQHDRGLRCLVVADPRQQPADTRLGTGGPNGYPHRRAQVGRAGFDRVARRDGFGAVRTKSAEGSVKAGHRRPVTVLDQEVQASIGAGYGRGHGEGYLPAPRVTGRLPGGMLIPPDCFLIVILDHLRPAVRVGCDDGNYYRCDAHADQADDEQRPGDVGREHGLHGFPLGYLRSTALYFV